MADATVPNGGSVFKAPAILDLQSTTANVTVNVPVAGNVSFYYKVSSEANYDFLIFTIDGVEPTAARWSGLVPWALATYPITAGAHTLSWKYLKDATLSANLDTAWISQLSIPAASATVTTVGTQMGGARQGMPLNLTTAVSTLAGSGTISAVDGTGTAASFYFPWGNTTDGTNLYVADSGNNKIRKIAIATGAVTTIAGSGAYSSIDGIGTAASFSSPKGITTDGTNLYVADTNAYKIRQIVIATGAVTTLAGSGTAGTVDGIGTAASFSQPTAITTDGTNLYVVEYNAQKIRKIVIATGAVTTLAGSGAVGAVDGIGTAASFNYPLGITTDGINLYLADSWNHKIRQIVISTGAVTTLAGSGAAGTVNGTGTAAALSNPNCITTDGTNLYVGEGSNYIRKVVIATQAVTTLAGSGTAGFNNATGTAAAFNNPLGITTDGASLYVGDMSNNMIRKIQ